MCKSKFLQTALGVLIVTLCSSAFAMELKYSAMSLTEYLDIVKQNNGQISNASLDVQTANANKEAQSLYRFNPSISYSRGAYQNQTPYAQYNVPASNTYALAFNVEGWGKRTARENLAQAQIEASSVQLDGANNNVQTGALNAYIDALRLALMVKSYKDALSKISATKDISKAKDAEGFLNRSRAIFEKDLLYTSLSLLNYTGRVLKEPPYPIGKLNFPVQSFNVEELVLQAQNNRIEVLNLQAMIDVADKNVALVTKNRNVDVMPYIGQTRTPQYTYNNGVSYTLPNIGQTISSSGTTYTAQNSITAGITIPIPINNYLQSADIVSASNQKLQFENKLQDTKAQIRVQVLQAFLQYEGARDSLINAQHDYQTTINKPSKDPVTTIMNTRDKEGILLDAQTNHLKALINLWRQSGNYSVPNL
jgi:outer membrane protein TolC